MSAPPTGQGPSTQIPTVIIQLTPDGAPPSRARDVFNFLRSKGEPKQRNREDTDTDTGTGNQDQPVRPTLTVDPEVSHGFVAALGTFVKGIFSSFEWNTQGKAKRDGTRRSASTGGSDSEVGDPEVSPPDADIERELERQRELERAREQELAANREREQHERRPRGR